MIEKIKEMVDTFTNERDYDNLTDQLFTRRDIASQSVHCYLDMVKRHLSYSLCHQKGSINYQRENVLLYQAENMDITFKMNDTVRVKHHDRITLVTKCTGIFEEIQEFERIFNQA